MTDHQLEIPTPSITFMTLGRKVGRRASFLSCGGLSVWAEEHGDTWSVHPRRGDPAVANGVRSLRVVSQALRQLWIEEHLAQGPEV